MSNDTVIVNLVRDDASVSRYEVPFEDNLTVTRILDLIYSGQDRTIAYRHFCCKNGECMSCLVKVDGKTVQACKSTVQPGTELWLEAANRDRAIRDLVMDFGGGESRVVPSQSIEV